MGKFDDALAHMIRHKLAVANRLAALESDIRHFIKKDGEYVDITAELIQEHRAQIADLDRLIAQVKALDA